MQQFIKEGGPHSILHTEDRVIAGNDAFAAPLASVPAVWITGGRQWRLADIYGGSRTARALYDLLARGGLIAGSSAGTSIMGSYLIRGSPSGNAVLMSPGTSVGSVSCATSPSTSTSSCTTGKAIWRGARFDLATWLVQAGVALKQRGSVLVVDRRRPSY